MYVNPNFKTKKALKDALKRGERVEVYEPVLGSHPPYNGRVSIEGPHFPEPHVWYAEAVVKDSIVQRVW